VSITVTVPARSLVTQARGAPSKETAERGETRRRRRRGLT